MQSSPQSSYVIVHTPALDGSRRVTEGDVLLGTAAHLEDVIEIVRLIGLDQKDVEEGDIIQWEGGGADEWPGLSAHPEDLGPITARL
ncbi:hypothetical protein ACIRP3_42900 [Streptomyces sp. NPDC101209]|uniref:hypothetical protein n=1 Tax=Streptomyces sp. NPDC101209 TaxID=3366129 RepID=UPI00381507C3